MYDLNTHLSFPHLKYPAWQSMVPQVSGSSLPSSQSGVPSQY